MSSTGKVCFYLSVALPVYLSLSLCLSVCISFSHFQVYELFLKNMVGGLHTVYTKLKRLEISPLICNVEQVRIIFLSQSEIISRFELFAAWEQFSPVSIAVN